MTLKDQLAESGCQKTKENIIPRGKFRLVENDLKVQQKVIMRMLKVGLLILLKCEVVVGLTVFSIMCPEGHFPLGGVFRAGIS